MSDEMPSGESDPRADALRRLLTEAVEPVEPAPGAQARLLARVRAERRRRREQPRRLRLATGVLAATAVVVAGGVYFAGKAGQDSKGSASSAAGAGTSATAPAAGPSPDAAAGRHAPSSGATGYDSAGTPSPVAPYEQEQSGSKTTSDRRTAGLPEAVLPPPDLDGDGVTDSLSVSGGALLAQLSRDGLQRVGLPPTGAGARVLGITLLDSASGGQVPVVFVRLQERAGYTQDTLASLVDGRLSVLKLGSTPVLLVRDAGHAYSCAGPLLISAGSSRSYVVTGSALQTADLRLAAARPAVPGCDFG